MAYQYEKVNHELLVPQIEDQLMMYMKQENIAIGEKLPSEYKLAELFGVGRSTIREAVKSLVTKGVLEVKRGSGTYVRSSISKSCVMRPNGSIWRGRTTSPRIWNFMRL